MKKYRGCWQTRESIAAKTNVIHKSKILTNLAWNIETQAYDTVPKTRQEVEALCESLTKLTNGGLHWVEEYRE